MGLLRLLRGFLFDIAGHAFGKISRLCNISPHLCIYFTSIIYLNKLLCYNSLIWIYSIDYYRCGMVFLLTADAPTEQHNLEDYNVRINSSRKR